MRSFPMLAGRLARGLVLAFGLPALAGACTDRISAPQADELLDAIGESEPAGVAPWERFSSSIGLPLAGLASRLPTVRVQRSWRSAAYHALVFERVMIPEQGLHPGTDCVGRRRILLLERSGAGGESLTFDTGPGERRIGWEGPPSGCTSADGHPLSLPRDATTLQWWRRSPGTPAHGWVAVSGSGSISEGVALGACTFLADDAVELLHDLGVRCEQTRHDVRFSARLRMRSDAPGDAPQAVPDASTRPTRSRSAPTETMRLPSTTVLGVRVTIDCHHSEQTAQRFCGGGGSGH